MTAITLDNAERTPCEVWTRCMGYHRPVSFFNPGKRAEHQERSYFRESPLGVHRLDQNVRRLEPITMIDGTRLGTCALCGSAIAQHQGAETAPCPRCGTEWICDDSGVILGVA
jgi:anaerobic ribonucleoside-triphosphate reductase